MDRVYNSFHTSHRAFYNLKQLRWSQIYLIRFNHNFAFILSTPFSFFNAAEKL